MRFDVTILGCGSATPTLHRGATSQYINILERNFLVDCGEGTQIQLRKFQIKFHRIDRIFISHLHGDHFFGLVGLLSSLHLLGRTNDIHIHAPEPLKEVLVANLRASQTQLNFNFIFHSLSFKSKELIFEDNLISVYSFPLRHRIDCCGFLFEEKTRERGMIKEAISEYSIPRANISGIKSGDDFVTADGTRIPNKQITRDPIPTRSYAYCSDTAYSENVIESIKGADLLYHEATFIELHKERAKQTFHSTAAEAATVAKKAGVKELIVGHYSARYKHLEDYQNEIEPIFKNYRLAEDGMVISIPHEIQE